CVRDGRRDGTGRRRGGHGRNGWQHEWRWDGSERGKLGERGLERGRRRPGQRGLERSGRRQRWRPKRDGRRRGGGAGGGGAGGAGRSGAGGACTGPSVAPPAFPGAEGFGKAALGGRLGDVYHVTTLADAGAGSLRDGVTTATGPRTIVFDISGTIALTSDLQ